MRTTNLVQGATLEEFRTDERLRLAVERTIQVVGEAARSVSPAFRAAHPDIPWREIVGLRNILVHEYGQVRAELIWGVATMHIPELLTQLEVRLPPPDEPD